MGTYTKNPLIVKVLSHLSWVEDFGSGKRNIKKYAPLYFPGYKVGIKSGQQFEFSITYQDLTGQVGQLLNIIGNDMLSTSEMMSRLGLKGRDNFRISYLAPVNDLFGRDPRTRFYHLIFCKIFRNKVDDIYL